MLDTVFSKWLKSKIPSMDIKYLSELLDMGECATQILLDGGLLPNETIIVKIMCALNLNDQEKIELIRVVAETTNTQFRDVYYRVINKYLELLNPEQNIYPLERKNNRVG